MQKKSYSCVLLDWDGNLARTLDIWLGALKTASLERGHEFTDKDIGANFTVFQERMAERGIQNVEAIVAQADEIATRECPEVELYPDALWTLQELHTVGKKLALVTTSRHDQIDPLLVRHGLDGLFDAVVCGDDVTHHKPHPEPLQKALALLGAQPEEAIMAGDSASDIRGAQNAGVDSVLFFPPAHETFYELEELRILKPTYVIEDFRQLIPVVGAQNEK
jgi:pyrophosphatase PpaX